MHFKLAHNTKKLSNLYPGKCRARAFDMRLVVPDGSAHSAVIVPLIAVPGQATLLTVVWKLVAGQDIFESPILK